LLKQLLKVNKYHRIYVSFVIKYWYSENIGKVGISMKRLLFILNSKSGKHQIKPHVCDMIDLYVSAGYEVTVHTTQAQGDAREVAETRGGGYDMIVCSGGDGTACEVVNGLLALDKVPCLGYIPAGTTNDYAKSLGIPTKLMEAARNTIEGQAYACDVGDFNGHFFVYIAAFGLFTDVSHQTPQETKNMIGHLAYILEGVKSLASVKSYHLKVQCDDIEITDDFIYGMVTNSISVGGFKMFTGKDMLLDDGLFEMLLIRMPQNLMDLQAIIGALLLQKVEDKYMVYTKTKEVTIICEDGMAWTLDGEDGGEHEVAHIFNCRKAIEIVRPVEVIEK